MQRCNSKIKIESQRDLKNLVKNKKQPDRIFFYVENDEAESMD